MGRKKKEVIVEDTTDNIPTINVVDVVKPNQNILNICGTKEKNDLSAQLFLLTKAILFQTFLTRKTTSPDEAIEYTRKYIEQLDKI